MQRRIGASTRTLPSHLEALLTAALQARAWAAASHCLHALLELGEVRRGEAALRCGVGGG